MDVNYIREINAFYNELEIKPLSSSAISLWYALLHLNNRCGWKDSFTVPVGTLSLKSGLSGRSVVNIRNELKTKGYLTFQSRDGNKSAVYQLKRLYANFADNLSDSSSDNVSCNLSDNASYNVSALKDKQKQNKNKNVIKPPISPKGERTPFTPPPLEAVIAYCEERGNNVDAEKWHDFYSSKGWMVGRNKMKDWQAAVRTWEKDQSSGHQRKESSYDVLQRMIREGEEGYGQTGRVEVNRDMFG